jgi:hypothetical protein
MELHSLPADLPPLPPIVLVGDPDGEIERAARGEQHAAIVARRALAAAQPPKEPNNGNKAK